MANSFENGFDDPGRQEHVFSLIDRGYAVYFGELAIRSETGHEYYALVMPGYDHETALLTLNEALEEEYLDMCDEAHHHMSVLIAEAYVPTLRLTESFVLHAPDTRTSETARGALIEATRAVLEFGNSQQDVRSENFPRRARLRQSRSHYRRR